MQEKSQLQTYSKKSKDFSTVLAFLWHWSGLKNCYACPNQFCITGISAYKSIKISLPAHIDSCFLAGVWSKWYDIKNSKPRSYLSNYFHYLIHYCYPHKKSVLTAACNHYVPLYIPFQYHFAGLTVLINILVIVLAFWNASIQIMKIIIAMRVYPTIPYPVQEWHFIAFVTCIQTNLFYSTLYLHF